MNEPKASNLTGMHYAQGQLTDVLIENCLELAAKLLEGRTSLGNVATQEQKDLQAERVRELKDMILRDRQPKQVKTQAPFKMREAIPQIYYSVGVDHLGKAYMHSSQLAPSQCRIGGYYYGSEFDTRTVVELCKHWNAIGGGKYFYTPSKTEADAKFAELS